MGERTLVTVLDTEIQLEEAQVLVGGYVERIWLSPHSHVAALLINEDARSTKLPFNLAASLLAGRNILGNVVLIYGDGLKGWA